MESRSQALVTELRRAIAQTPDAAEQKVLYEKLGLLEIELAELDRRQRAVGEADAQLAQAKETQLLWRVVIGALVAALIGTCLWLVVSVFPIS